MRTLHAVLLGLVLLVAGCEGDDLIKNPEVDEWCGDTPCGWDVDGQVERVGTWHSHDYAVAFVSEDARLHQANLEADASIGCMSFSMIAKVSPGTKAFVELDFLDDGGEPEWSERIPAAEFERFTFYVTPPTWFEGVRFSVRKEGPGEMVLAKLRAVDDVGDYERCTAAPVELDGRPSYAACEIDSQCLSGRCTGGECADCTSDRDCEEGVCGYVERRYDGADEQGWFSLLWTPNAVPGCIEARSRVTGSLCLGDAECGSGVCCEGVCSECCGDGSCEGGVECAPSVAPVARESYALPHQCAPGAGRSEPGAFCTDDSDCMSGACGERLCSGLCSAYFEQAGFPDCAKSACEGSSCGPSECEIETVEVGRCH